MYFVLLLTFQQALQTTDWFPIVKLETNGHDLHSDHTVRYRYYITFYVYKRKIMEKLKTVP